MIFATFTYDCGHFSHRYPEADLGKWANAAVLAVRWTPLLLMYMIDLQLWFMLWTALYGTVLGCKLHIGEVPDFSALYLPCTFPVPSLYLP